MIREIVKDKNKLCLKSEKATKEDSMVIQDLKDTLVFHSARCVGMAANMIGVLKRIIVVKDGKEYLCMLNPVLLKTSGKRYVSEEGCLCHEGAKEATRYETIKVEYEDELGRKRIKSFHGFTAQIIQHEMDHCDGILI